MRSPSTPKNGENTEPSQASEPNSTSCSTEPVVESTYQPRISASISNAQEVARSAGHWKRKLRTANGASIAPRAYRSSPLSTPQESNELLFGQRHADQVALHLVAAQEAQQPRVLLGLDALGDHPQPQRVRERDDGRHQRERARVLAHAHHERAVDLERLDRQLCEVAERGVA